MKTKEGASGAQSRTSGMSGRFVRHAGAVAPLECKAQPQ